MNPLNVSVYDARAKKRKLFCAFLTLGFPNLEATERMILQFEDAGVDILELGIPFSDPLADGPTIQYSSECALKKNVSLRDGMKLVKRIRSKGCRLPILCFTYFNPVLQFGLSTFAETAKTSGFDGVIIPDLPPDSERLFVESCKSNDLAQVFLVAPTTLPDRAQMICDASQGFVYYVSLRGVTGARKSAQADVKKQVMKLRRLSSQPILIGFGVSNPAQAKAYSSFSDGVIVGSAIIDQIRKSPNHLGRVTEFVRSMAEAVHS